jgi:hypothetical protein
MSNYNDTIQPEPWRRCITQDEIDSAPSVEEILRGAFKDMVRQHDIEMQMSVRTMAAKTAATRNVPIKVIQEEMGYGNDDWSN